MSGVSGGTGSLVTVTLLCGTETENIAIYVRFVAFKKCTHIYGARRGGSGESTRNERGPRHANGPTSPRDDRAARAPDRRIAGGSSGRRRYTHDPGVSHARSREAASVSPTPLHLVCSPTQAHARTRTAHTPQSKARQQSRRGRRSFTAAHLGPRVEAARPPIRREAQKHTTPIA